MKIRLELITTTAAALMLGAAITRTAAEPTADNASSVYQQRCARCHDGGADRAPDRAALKLLPAGRVRASLASGTMREHATGLSDAELDSLASWVGSTAVAMVGTGSRCTSAFAMPTDAFARPHWNGWGAGVAQRRFQEAAMAGLAAADVPKLELKWSFGFADAIRANAQPTIVGGRLFVGSATGKVYALDARTGCTFWQFTADAPVRTAISIGFSARGWMAYFGDQRGNAYAVDVSTGQQVWSSRVDSHPTAMVTGAPTVYGDMLLVPVASHEEAAAMGPGYACCTFRGSVVALDVQTGKRLWQSFTISTVPAATRKSDRDVQLFGPSGASVWSSPTVDPLKRLVYATTGNSYSDPPSDGANAFVAFRLDDGSRVWVRQMTANDAYTMACNSSATGGSGNCPQANGPDVDFGSSAMLVTLPGGRRALIAGQKSGDVHALDPDREGAVLWQTKVGAGGKLGGVQWGTAADERHVYVAVSDVRVARAEPGTPGAQPTPFGIEFRVDPDAGGGLVALKLDTGEVVWRTPHPGCRGTPGCSPAQSAAVTAIPGVVFSGGVDGHLRAYDTAGGRIVWDVDTKRAYNTVNGVAARGGSLDGPGAVVVDGMLYVNSGYAFFGGAPGNVLLAFSVGGK